MASKLNDKEIASLLKLLGKALGAELTIATEDDDESDDDESDDEESDDEESDDEESDDEESDDEESDDEESDDEEEEADPLEAARTALKALVGSKGKPVAVKLLKKHGVEKISDLKGKKLAAFTVEATKLSKAK